MFDKLKKEIEECRYCEEKFGFEPHPIFFGNEKDFLNYIS